MTSSYFENQMNASQDFAFNALSILERAYELEENSTSFFKDSNEESNKEMSELMWKMSMEASERAHGLIDAYQIISGREVLCFRCAIADEIDFVKNAVREREMIAF